jgi:transposase-like protein
VRVKGRWFYLCRGIDSTGATIDLLLSPMRSADAAQALFAKALADPSHPPAASDQHGPSQVLPASA